MWKAQLKVSPSFTKPKIKIKPEEKETNCKEALKKIFEFWDNYKTSWENSKHLSRWDIEKQFNIIEHLDDVHEKVCCRVIELTNRMFDTNTGHAHHTDAVGNWHNGGDGAVYEIHSKKLTNIKTNRRAMDIILQGIDAWSTLYQIRILVFANDEESKPASKQMIEDIQGVMKRQFKEAS